MKISDFLSRNELAINGLDDLDEIDQRDLYIAIKNSAGQKIFIIKRHRFFGHGGIMLQQDYEGYLNYLLRYYDPGDDRRAQLEKEVKEVTTTIHQCVVDRALRNIAAARQ